MELDFFPDNGNDGWTRALNTLPPMARVLGNIELDTHIEVFLRGVRYPVKGYVSETPHPRILTLYHQERPTWALEPHHTHVDACEVVMYRVLPDPRPVD